MLSECRERQQLEAEALQHIFGEERVAVVGLDIDIGFATELPQIVVTLVAEARGWHDNPQQSDLHLQFDLPVDYPELSPPTASISGPDLPRHALARLQETTCSIIKETFTGAECLFDVSTQVQEFAASLLEKLPELQHPSCAGLEHEPEEPCYSTLVRIDHMNDRHGYCSLLRKWADQLSLHGILVLGTSGPRPSNIALLLSGSESGVSSFLKRLRTEYVDVNSRGQKCKERKSDVLCTFILPPAEVSASPSLDIKTYSTTQELHVELKAVGALEHWLAHVS